jgi:Adenylate and Guanylate cyclase catalytic domain
VSVHVIHSKPSYCQCTIFSHTLLTNVSLFNAFDVVAKKHNIFKVETSGDCYVAAAGVPDLMKDHAGQMARFALACQAKMKEVGRYLFCCGYYVTRFLYLTS